MITLQYKLQNICNLMWFSDAHCYNGSVCVTKNIGNINCSLCRAVGDLKLKAKQQMIASELTQKLSSRN